MVEIVENNNRIKKYPRNKFRFKKQKQKIEQFLLSKSQLLTTKLKPPIIIFQKLS